MCGITEPRVAFSRESGMLERSLHQFLLAGRLLCEGNKYETN